MFNCDYLLARDSKFMIQNWAIVIGINQYESDNFQSQQFAKRDAELVRDRFQAAHFDQVYCFAEDLPDITLPSGIVLPTRPTYRNLLAFFELCFREPFLTVGDNLWFFFSGQGVREYDRQYLLPQDANFHAIAQTAFAVGDICTYLRSSGADNIMLWLDADRQNRDASAIEPDHPAGVVLVAACRPTQRSWENKALNQGFFAQALMEVLHLSSQDAVFFKPFEMRARQCATLEQIEQYLSDRMTDLYRLLGHSSPPEPYLFADPPEKRHFILFPDRVRINDITVLKQDAYRQIQQGHLGWAEQICRRMGAVFQTYQTEARTTDSAQSSPVTSAAIAFDLDWMRLHAAIQQLQLAPQPLPPLSGQAANRAIPLLSMILEDQLASDRQLNYQTLQNLLQGGQWQQANQETRSLMQQAGGQAIDPLTPQQMQQDLQELLANSPEGFTAEAREVTQNLLRFLQQATPRELGALESLIGLGELSNRMEIAEAFPLTDLFTIDHLWVKYSQGRFGFSIQKRIYLECGGTADDNNDVNDDVGVWNQFVDRVGWQNQEQGQADRQIEATPSALPDGHFPSPNFLEAETPSRFWWWRLVQHT